MTESETHALLNMFGERLASPLGFALKDDKGIPADHPLAGEISAALAGEIASLPFPRQNAFLWVTIAPNADALRRGIEDLRCWILPSLGWEANPAVVADVGKGKMGELLLARSPQGYFRWYCRPDQVTAVADRLKQLRAVIAAAPNRGAHLRPTLEMLRRQFTLALATGDREAATRAVDEIDKRQLDVAVNSLSMRIRLAAAIGDDRAIVDHPQLDHLLSTRIPKRVAESILLAHHSVYLADREASNDLDAVLDAYAPIADRLAGLATEPSAGADPALVRLAAYDAAERGDLGQLAHLHHRFSSDTLLTALANRLTPGEPDPDGVVLADSRSRNDAPDGLPQRDDGGTQSAPLDVPSVELSVPDSGQAKPAPAAASGEAVNEHLVLPAVGKPDWETVPAMLAAGELQRLTAFLAEVVLTPDSCDPGNGDFLLEIFTDDAIAAEPKKRAAADVVLTTVLDAYVCEDLFPRRERLPLYSSLLDLWSENRAASSDPIDGQMLLTLADAMLRIDGHLEGAASTAIARWWDARPVRARLSWLGEALELLTEQSAAKDYLTLWFAGAREILIDHEGIALADRYLWQRLGRRLGLDASMIEEALGSDWTAIEDAGDPLAQCGFKKIAIVSLNERAAREAAEQIGQRCGIDVLVVTDHAAGEGTASAATADVILFVWGATKHAVYRAFDKVRDRLEYVQGTGSTSIVRALERRARFPLS